MALTQQQAEAIAKSLSGSFKDLRVEVKSSSVHATAKTMTCGSGDLSALAHIAQGREVTFGRTGANFRMIIE